MSQYLLLLFIHTAAAAKSLQSYLTYYTLLFTKQLYGLKVPFCE